MFMWHYAKKRTIFCQYGLLYQHRHCWVYKTVSLSLFLGGVSHTHSAAFKWVFSIQPIMLPPVLAPLSSVPCPGSSSRMFQSLKCFFGGDEEQGELSVEHGVESESWINHENTQPFLPPFLFCSKCILAHSVIQPGYRLLLVLSTSWFIVVWRFHYWGGWIKLNAFPDIKSRGLGWSWSAVAPSDT